jgi:hypothetical protein
MNRFKLLAAVLATFALAAPAQPQGRTAKGAFTIRVGRERAVEGADLRIAFLGVTEDSRCPEGAMCIWAGNASLRMSARTSQGEATVFSLNTNLPPREFDFGAYRIKLVRLTPHPSIHAELKPSKYAAELVVTKVQKD